MWRIQSKKRARFYGTKEIPKIKLPIQTEQRPQRPQPSEFMETTQPANKMSIEKYSNFAFGHRSRMTETIPSREIATRLVQIRTICPIPGLNKQVALGCPELDKTYVKALKRRDCANSDWMMVARDIDNAHCRQRLVLEFVAGSSILILARFACRPDYLFGLEQRPGSIGSIGRPMASKPSTKLSAICASIQDVTGSDIQTVNTMLKRTGHSDLVTLMERNYFSVVWNTENDAAVTIQF